MGPESQGPAGQGTTASGHRGWASPATGWSGAEVTPVLFLACPWSQEALATGEEQLSLIYDLILDLDVEKAFAIK